MARGVGAGEFDTAVVAVIEAIPAGEVMTYGEVALEAGFPGAARAVGHLLATSDGALPWWRVVNASGRLVPGHEREHARRLRSEGVALRPGGGRVSMARRG
jgi:methylated-DNA-protein-cysteine methyltransferase related protein